jgi:hypothetical protein
MSADASERTTAAPKPTRSGRHRPRVRPYYKHGLTTLRRTVEDIGGRLLDGRTTLAKQLVAWRAARSITATRPAFRSTASTRGCS